MDTIQRFSIKETREQLSHLVDQVAIAQRQFMITKFGKPRAMLIPIMMQKSTQSTKKGLMTSFGAWKNRKDIKDSAKWVAGMRKEMSSRYGTLFG